MVNTIRPSGSQAAPPPPNPLELGAVLHRLVFPLPSTRIFQSRPSDEKPSHSPSGDQNGLAAPSVSGTLTGFSSLRSRTQREPSRT